MAVQLDAPVWDCMRGRVCVFERVLRHVYLILHVVTIAHMCVCVRLRGSVSFRFLLAHYTHPDGKRGTTSCHQQPQQQQQNAAFSLHMRAEVLHHTRTLTPFACRTVRPYSFHPFFR